MQSPPNSPLRKWYNRSQASTKNTIRRCWRCETTRNGVSTLLCRPSRRTVSCSGAGWTRMYGQEGHHKGTQPAPLICPWIKWGHRMTRIFPWSLREVGRGMWVTSALGGGAGGGPTFAHPKFPGLHWPDVSYRPAGRLEHRTTSPGVSVTGPGR